jgi:hypothetical protein
MAGAAWSFAMPLPLVQRPAASTAGPARKGTRILLFDSAELRFGLSKRGWRL